MIHCTELYTWMQRASSPTHIYESHCRHTEEPVVSRLYSKKLSSVFWNISHEQLNLPVLLNTLYFIITDAPVALSIQMGECWEFLSLSPYQLWKHSQLKSQILPEGLVQELPAGLYFYSGVIYISEWPEGVLAGWPQNTVQFKNWCSSLILN